MNRSIRTLLGLTAAAGIVALSVPAFGTAASASTAGTAAKSASTDFYGWGPYFSKNYKAKARGSVFVKWDHEHESNKVNVKGRLYDLDYRTFKQGGQCAFVKFKVHHLGDPHFKWQGSDYYYKWCGADKGPRYFSFWEHDVDRVEAKVCQISKYGKYPFKCGYWKPVYHEAL